MKLRNWLSSMLPFRKRHDTQRIIDAIHILDGKVDQKDIDDCLDYLHHNEPEIALNIVIDRLEIRQISISRQEMVTLHSAWSLVSEDESRLDLIEIEEGH